MSKEDTNRSSAEPSNGGAKDANTASPTAITDPEINRPYNDPMQKETIQPTSPSAGLTTFPTKPVVESPGFLSRMKKKWTDTSSLFANIAALVSLFATVALGGFLWLNSKIDEVVKQRIEPYESYQLGSILSQDDEFDLAIPVLEDAFDTIVKKEESDERLLPFLDSYLHAIVNSKNPSSHTSRFAKIEKLINEYKISPNGYHYNEMGWFYLRTGKLQKARENLEEARNKYTNDELYRSLANTHWALVLTFIAEGDLDKAVFHTQEAARRNPREYEIGSILSDQNAMKDDPWIRKLIATSDTFKATLPAYFERLSKLNQQATDNKGQK